MSATRVRVAFVVFAFCILASAATYPQEPFQLSAAKSHPIRVSPAKLSPACVSTQVHGHTLSDDAALRRTTDVPELWILDDLATTNVLHTACMAPSADVPAHASSADIPCGSRAATFPPCPGSFIPFQVGLTPLGKPGDKIARAREEVLSILSSRNTCSAWFEQKEPDPAAIFRTMTYEVDKHGPYYIFQSRLLDGLSLIRQPYAARVTQDGGPYSVITINAQGAFYQSQAFVQERGKEGGSITRRGPGDLKVGFYHGATLEAQMLTLLHEFGHVIGLLPQDGDDMDGTSLQNTSLVLRNCRAEIEARSKPNAHLTLVR